ncbi:hypothetical protein GOBAR_DD24473 [Gossypium barbadense]|nr:hypothetical protein GOBAR_DD24473 [Gossypium barbadense]
MYVSIFLPWLLTIPFLVHSSPDQQPKGLLINCGSDVKQTVKETGLTYIPDDGFTFSGNKTSLDAKNLLPILSTLRYFPDKVARKYCYTFQAIKGLKYLVRTIYYYGGFDGGKEPPVFDQITLSVCIARNNQTVSSPFISAIEVISLDDSMYNSTDLGAYALVTVARSSFGNEDTISFPEDPYYRLWQPFKDDSTDVVSSQSSITTSEFWNKPPAEAFVTAITMSTTKKLDVQWPPGLLPSTRYHVSLYFRDDRNSKTNTWRVFSILVNGKTFYSNLNVTTDGVTVYAPNWPLSGKTLISLIPDTKSSIAPLINAGEIYQLMPLGGRTLPQDVMAMEELARGFDNPPLDWSGDPCLPRENSWTGVSCSQEKMPRIISLFLQHNKLDGPIPQELQGRKGLHILHLESNNFTGPIPKSLATLQYLREVSPENHLSA